MKRGGLWLAFLLALLAPVVPAILLAASLGFFAQVSDLPNYCAAARLMVEGRGAEIYDLVALGAKEKAMFPALGERVVGFYMPPLALPWLLPVSICPSQSAPYAGLALLMAGLAGSLLVLKRLFSMSLAKILWIWAVVAVSGPLYEALRIGQPAPLLLLALILAVWSLNAGRPLLAALAMSFLLLKPHLLLPFVVYLLGARRYRPLVYLFFLGAVLTLVSLMVIGPQGFENYLSLMKYSMQNTMAMQPELDSTLRGQLLRLFPGSKQAVTFVSLVFFVSVLVSIWFSGRSYMRYRQWLELGLVTSMPIGLVSSLYCHDYDLLLLVPSVVSLLSLGVSTFVPAWTRLLTILGATMLLLPLYVFIHYDYLLVGGLVNPIFLYLLAVSVGMVVLVYRSRLDLLLDGPGEPA